MDKLNYFNPYHTKSSKHEDNLTRAFLALVNLIPGVQTAFFELIREKQIKKILSGDNDSAALLPSFIQSSERSINIQTQTGSLGSDKGKLLSILISDERLNYDVIIKQSNRTAIYDGVINFEIDHDEWIFIIENKPNVNHVWEDQLRPSLQQKIKAEGDESLQIIDYFISIQWLELIDMLYSLIDTSLVSKGEHNLIQQFFDYVNEHYPELNPYDTFAKCGDHEVLIKKRCNLAMERLSKEELGSHRGWKTYVFLQESSVKRFTIFPDGMKDSDWHIVIAMHPGDTVSQARSFFKKLSQGENVEKLFSLLKKGRWKAQTNLHFAHISSHLHWVSGKLPFEDYISYWMNNPNKIKQFKKKEGEFTHVYDPLLKHGLILKNDIEKLEELYKNRNSINVCPGLTLTYALKKSEVLKIETQGKNSFEKKVLSNINELLNCWTNFRL